MISSQEIRTVTFEKSMRGYRAEDVDSFLQQVADTIDELTKEKEESRKKLYILAQKIEEYRKDEDNLKTALLNAQRMGEKVPQGICALGTLKVFFPDSPRDCGGMQVQAVCESAHRHGAKLSGPPGEKAVLDL